MAFEQVKFYQTGTFTVGNRLLAPEERSVQANMRRTNSLNSGHREAIQIGSRQTQVRGCFRQ